MKEETPTNENKANTEQVDTTIGLTYHLSTQIKKLAKKLV